MRTTEWQKAVRHLRSWAPTSLLVVLLFGFAFTAQEVTEGEPIAFDRWLMVAFRHASDLSRPIGPPWLLDVVRDITALGSTAVLALLVTIVTTFLFTTGKRHAGLFVLTTVLSGALLNTLLCLPLREHGPISSSTHSGFYTELSERTRSKFGCLLSDARLDARADASFPLSSHSSHSDRRDPDPVGRCQPHISRSSLSKRCAGGMVLRRWVGANLRDVHVVFSAYRKDRAAERLVTAISTY